MASAQLIKHSFNRERELLADATSVQLTRSPAIMETLKAIHKDSLGSRLTAIADINGLSHFFFASSGADLGDVSWFATHPSLNQRMSAINANAYHDFAVKVAKEKRLNQQKIKEIYEQRRLGDWGVITENSLSKINIHKDSTNKDSYSTKKSITSNPDEAIGKEITAFSTAEMRSESEAEDGLEFVVEQDVVIDGRLQVAAESIGTHKLLKPWQAKSDRDLPSDTLIGIEDIQKISLPQYVLNHSYHPLGAQALIEAVLLCHQGCTLSTTATYDLTDIWLGLPNDKEASAVKINNKSSANNSSHVQFLAHRLDHKLLETVAGLDRRLDSALIALAVKNLSQHDLSESAINELHLKYEASHSNQDYQHYVQQKKCRTMLLRYQQGMIELFKTYLTADLSQKIAATISDNDSIDKPKPVLTRIDNTNSQLQSISALWQALQLQQLLPILSTVLNDKQSQSHVLAQTLWQQTLHAGTDDIYTQLDPSGQIFMSLDVAAKTMLVLLAYRLSRDAKGQMVSALDSSVHISMLNYNNDSVVHYIVDLRRYARLIDIDLAVVSEANLQWLLLTAQNLNSVQLLALIEAVPIFKPTTADSNHDDNSQEKQQERQQRSGQIDYNAMTSKPYAYNDYRQWLSTLHTSMLHDTIVSQDEYDCLTLLSELWLKVRQLF